MKILQINKYHYIKGGADSVFFNTMDLLKKNGHEVVPFSIHHPENRSSDYSDYFVDAPEIRNLEGLGEKIKGIPRFIANKDAAEKIEALLGHQKFDVVHIHNLFNGISLAILPVLKKYKIPVVITMHEPRFICPSSYFNLRGKWCELCAKSLFLNCVLRRCYQDSVANSVMTAWEMIHKEYFFKYDKYIERYIFVSRRYLDLHAERHDYFRKKGSLLYNFIPDLENLSPNGAKGEYLFFYGRITVEKGILNLVEAMRRFPNHRLKVAGTGVLLDSLKEKALPNIDFLGFVTGDALLKLIREASFVIAPSQWEENNPLVIIEAYSLGKPVIGSRIGGIPEIIEKEKTGFVFEPFNEESLIEVLAQALAVTDSEYEGMSKNARAFAEKHFHPEGHYKHLLAIYNQAIANA